LWKTLWIFGLRFALNPDFSAPYSSLNHDRNNHTGCILVWSFLDSVSGLQPGWCCVQLLKRSTPKSRKDNPSVFQTASAVSLNPDDRISRMHWLADNYKWLFDGVAGAALVALVGYVVHLFRRQAAEKTVVSLKTQDSQVANSGSPVAISSTSAQVFALTMRSAQR
jgi:hypothetical protein